MKRPQILEKHHCWVSNGDKKEVLSSFSTLHHPSSMSHELHPAQVITDCRFSHPCLNNGKKLPGL